MKLEFLFLIITITVVEYLICVYLMTINDGLVTVWY